MNLPFKTLNDLYTFIRENNYPSELTISVEDYNRIFNKLQPTMRAPGQFSLGVTLVKAKAAPPMDVSHLRLFE